MFLFSWGCGVKVSHPYIYYKHLINTNMKLDIKIDFEFEFEGKTTLHKYDITIKDRLMNWIIYEELNNGSSEVKNVWDFTKLFYACCCADRLRTNEGFMDLREFVEWLDWEENEPFEQFCEWFKEVSDKRLTRGKDTKKKKVKK